MRSSREFAETAKRIVRRREGVDAHCRRVEKFIAQLPEEDVNPFNLAMYRAKIAHERKYLGVLEKGLAIARSENRRVVIKVWGSQVSIPPETLQLFRDDQVQFLDRLKAEAEELERLLGEEGPESKEGGE
jgi:hypothetical protein